MSLFPCRCGQLANLLLPIFQPSSKILRVTGALVVGPVMKMSKCILTEIPTVRAGIEVGWRVLGIIAGGSAIVFSSVAGRKSWHDARQLPEYDSHDEHMAFLPDAAVVGALRSTLAPIRF